MGMASDRKDREIQRRHGEHHWPLSSAVTPAFRAEHIKERASGSGFNAVRLAVRAELIEAHSAFDRLRANGLN